MKKDRPILDWLRDKLRPPDVVPIRRTWGQYSSAVFWWATRIILLWLLKGC